MAALYVLASLCDKCENTHIRIMIDNKTAVAYVNNMGGRKVMCNSVTRKIWLWCKQRNIWLSAAYIKSKDNDVADKMSRMSHMNSEWSLNKQTFQKMIDTWGIPTLDLFASRLNYKCERYVAWQPDPYCVSVDAFTLDWGQEQLSYIFPPFCIIHKILQKIDFDEANALIIVPLWTTQPWWSKLLRLLTDCPFYFNRNTRHLSHPHRDITELPRMTLLACSISGQRSRQMRFLRKHRGSLCLHGGHQPRSSIKSTLIGGRNLLLEGRSICLRPL